MVGNDVVDLNDPETADEGLNPRFDSRVFCADERRQIALAADAKVLRWMLWAAKESAYKLCKRSNPTTVFAHARFETELDDGGCGTVCHADWTCAVEVTCGKSAIHAIATAEQDDRERVVSGVKEISCGADPGHDVRRFAIESIARSIGVERKALTITSRPDRIPLLHHESRVQGFLSLSHHGSLVAFAWIPTE